MNQLVDLQPRIVEKMIEDNITMIDVRRPESGIELVLLKYSSFNFFWWIW